ncbi:MAG: DUF6398 domain-containing protein [Armatimonadota bacterium]
MSENVPKTVKPTYDAITALTDRVCEEHLDNEYADLARRMTAKLARKRPSPLQRGTVPVWACAIVYTLARINFLFDKSTTPYLSADDLCAPFEVSPRTAATKSKMIIDLLDTMACDPEWTTPSELGDNPLVWMMQLPNGMVVDVRSAPREFQEQIFEMGLIPYIPADRKGNDVIS